MVISLHNKEKVYTLIVTYRLSQSDHAKQLDDVAMAELAHDGRLLEKHDRTVRCSILRLQCLDSHVLASVW